jgi:hypothetical protein
VVVSQGSWHFKSWIPYADACSPKDVSFIPLDNEVYSNQSEIDSPEEIEWLRKLADSGRRIIPVIWSHHDDGNYIGRTHTPFSNFATLLEQAGCDSYGIIHWALRPHGLYFKSHSVQVWKSTKDQPLEETCRTMAQNIFGDKNETFGGQYLFDWITNAPIYGRETGNYMIDRPFSAGQRDSFQYDSQRRKALLNQIRVSPAHPSAARHLAYWKGLEDFNVRFWSDETALQQSVNALKNGDISAAKDYIAKTDPASTIRMYADYASQLGIIAGDRGILTLMNLKWYSSFIGQHQILENDSYRINFAPTVHEPLAQGGGLRSFHIDRNSKLWLVQGKRELQGAEWVLPENVTWKQSNLSESDWEIMRTGLTWTASVKIPVVPAMLNRFAPQKFEIPFGGQSLKLRLYIADPTVKTAGDAVFDVLLYEGDKPSKLGTIMIEPNVAKVFEFEFEISDDSRSYNISLGHLSAYFLQPYNISLGIEPRKGKVSLCGLTVETVSK